MTHGRQEELNRARRLYEERDASAQWSEHWSILNPAVQFALAQRQRAVLAAIARHFAGDLSAARVLDVGCGAGGELLRMAGYGVESANMAGVDLSSERIERAKRLLPAADLRACSADDLPFESESFDIVTQFTLLSSVLDGAVCDAIASEMIRVLASGGIILSYDVRSDWLLGRLVWRRLSAESKETIWWIGAADIRRIFSGCDVALKSVTLFDPIARMVAGRSWMVCEMLEKIPGLRGHWLAVVTKKRGGRAR